MHKKFYFTLFVAFISCKSVKYQHSTNAGDKISVQTKAHYEQLEKKIKEIESIQALDIFLQSMLHDKSVNQEALKDYITTEIKKIIDQLKILMSQENEESIIDNLTSVDTIYIIKNAEELTMLKKYYVQYVYWIYALNTIEDFYYDYTALLRERYSYGYGLRPHLKTYLQTKTPYNIQFDLYKYTKILPEKEFFKVKKKVSRLVEHGGIDASILDYAASLKPWGQLNNLIFEENEE